MVREDSQRIINNNIRNYFDFLGCKNLSNPTLNTHNSLEHEMKKCEICYNLQKDGREFVCEGKLIDGKGRPDICVLDVDPPIAYEIVCSEDEESLEAKRKKYPFKFVEVKI